MNIETIYNNMMTKQAFTPTPRQARALKLRHFGRAIATPFKWLGKQMQKHPVASTAGVVTGTGLGAGTTGYVVGRESAKESPDVVVPDPVVEAFKDPMNMSEQQRNSTMIGGGAALASGTGLYFALRSIPGLRRRRLLRAVLATLGAGGVGYAAWRAADNYQTNSQQKDNIA